MQVFLKSSAILLIFGLAVFGQTLRKPEDYYARAVGRLERGELAGALDDLNRAIEMLPKYSAAYAVRGSLKRTQGDIEGALADLGRSIELTPEFAIPYYKRGFLLHLELNKDGKDYLEQRIKYIRYQRDKKGKS